MSFLFKVLPRGFRTCHWALPAAGTLVSLGFPVFFTLPSFSNWNFLWKVSPFFPISFVQSSNHYGLMDIYSFHWVIIWYCHYFVAQIVPGLVIRSSFRQAPVSLWHAHRPFLSFSSSSSSSPFSFFPLHKTFLSGTVRCPRCILYFPCSLAPFTAGWCLETRIRGHLGGSVTILCA